MTAGRSRTRQFLRDTLREWRSPELRVLAAALVIAVTAVAAVGFFADRVDRSMTQQATTLLGGDLAVASDTPIPASWLQEAEARGLSATRSATLPSVLFTPDDDSQLVSVRAVDQGWPLRGTAQLAGESDPDTRASGPAPGRAWADGALLQALEIRPGVAVELGTLSLEIEHQLLLEPDRGSNLFELAPRLLIHFDDLEPSGLIGPGSRVRYQFLAAGAAGPVEDLRRWLEGEMQLGQRLLDLDDANPQLLEAVSRARRFLGLASLMAVLLAGAAIAVATHHYANRRADAAAVMRALGASGRRVLRIYLLRILVIAGVASSIGLALGFGAQFGLSALLGDWLAADLPAPGWRPVVASLGVGLITAAGFALPALLRIGQVPPLRVLQRNLGLPPVSVALSAALALLSLGGLLYWQAADPVLALWVLIGTGLALAILGALGLLLIVLVRPLRDRGGMALRFGLANLSRRGGLSAIQMVAFSLGILALLLLAIVRVDLVSAWEQNIPAQAPNLFLINIQPDQQEVLADRIEASGLPRPELEPMIRGRLVAINGQPVSPADFEDDRARRLLERAFNLSYAQTLPSHNSLTAGAWFADAATTGPGVERDEREQRDEAKERGEWSVESGLMERFNLALGDTLSFSIAGSPVEGRITSIREVDWDSFRVNFFVIGSPALLADEPQTFITSLYLPPEQEAEKNRWLREFPAVTAIDVGALLTQVRAVIAQATRAVEYVFLFTLFAGLTVLYAAVQATRETRRRETALLRTLGARRSQIRNGLLAEFGTLGLLSGLLAAAIASAVGALLATQVFGFPYTVNPWIFVFGLGGGALGIGFAGWLGTRRVLDQPPLSVLRGQE